MRQSVILCLLMALCLGVFAQKTISGKVTATDGSPVPSASVSFNNSTGGITNVDGRYSFTISATPGKYQLVISAVGYKSFSQTITITSAANYTADAVLAEDALNLDEVVVTGTSAGTTRKQLGSYVSTVKAIVQEKDNSGVGTVKISTAIKQSAL